MIVEYHRPNKLEDAIKLINRQDCVTLPLGGGTFINAKSRNEDIAVVDLQNLALDSIEATGKKVLSGAMVTLQQMIEHPLCPQALRDALLHEADYNRRQVATIGGTIFAGTGRSPLLTMLLAMDGVLSFASGKKEKIGDFLPLRNKESRKTLLVSIELPLDAKIAYQYVARTPTDKPIVCVALAKWRSGRTRLALGGFGNRPLLAMDGNSNDGLEDAARNAFHEAGDQWAGAEYRMDAAVVLSTRCLQAVQK